MTRQLSFNHHLSVGSSILNFPGKDSAVLFCIILDGWMHKFAKYRFTCFCTLLRFHFFASSSSSPPGGCGRTNPLILERVHFFDRFRIRPSGSSHRSVHQIRPPRPPPPSPLSYNILSSITGSIKSKRTAATTTTTRSTVNP